MWSGRRSAGVLNVGAVCVLALVVGLGAACAAARAEPGHVDGISDQSLSTWDGSFSTSPFAAFFRAHWAAALMPQITLARYVVQWDAMAEGGADAHRSGNYRQRFEAWLEDARSLGLTPTLALTSYDRVYPGSPGEYRPRLEALLDRAAALGYAIRYVEPWNEPNGQGALDAVTAAGFANSANDVCERARTCRVIAGDFEDRSTAIPYVQAYLRALAFPARIWGIHPYVSVESHTTANLLRLISALPAGPSGREVWFTEVGARYCSRGEVRGEARQAGDASYLVHSLLGDPAVAPAHAFYYGFLFGYRAQAPCAAGVGEDSELYASSGAPRAAAQVILMPARAAKRPPGDQPPRWPPWTLAASLMIEPPPGRV
jgi:hypothetical protein